MGTIIDGDNSRVLTGTLTLSAGRLVARNPATVGAGVVDATRTIADEEAMRICLLDTWPLVRTVKLTMSEGATIRR